MPGMNGFVGGNSSDEEESDAEASESGGEEQQEIDDEVSDDESAASSSAPPSRNPFGRPDSSARKQALWQDPSDEQVSVRLSDDKRLRKLARGKEGEDSDVRGKELETKLRAQYVYSRAVHWSTLTC